MPEISAADAALSSFESSVEYYAAGLRRCLPDDEPKWREKRDAAQRVVEAITAYNEVYKKWRVSQWLIG